MTRAGNSPPSDPDDAEAAYHEAVRRLARQAQSQAWLRTRLMQAGFSRRAADVAITRIAAAGYLNDAEFAQNLVRRRQSVHGSALIARELRAKGIAEELVESALNQVDPAEEGRQAKRLAMAALDRRPAAERRQIVQIVGPMLDRRGFSSRIIQEVLAELNSAWRPQPFQDTTGDGE